MKTSAGYIAPFPKADPSNQFLRFVCLALFIFLPMITLSAQTKALFLVAGQSNAVGVGDSSQSAHCNGQCGWEFMAPGNSLKPLKDPVGYDDVNEGFQAAVNGSAWPAFGERFSALTGVKPIIIQAARGGSANHFLADMGAGNWTEKDILFRNSVIKTQKAIALTELPLSGIIWLQGESDAIAIQNNTIEPCDYQAALRDLIRRFRTELGCEIPFFIIQTGRFLPEFDEGFSAARKTQESVALADSNTFIVHSATWDFVEWGFMTDEIHYDQRGLNHVGTGTAESIAGILSMPGFPVFDTTCQNQRPPASDRTLLIGPNPVKGELHIYFATAECEPVVTVVSDLAGQVVRRFETGHNFSRLPTENEGLEIMLDMKGLSPGIYLLQIVSGRYFRQQKIVVD